jgi:PBP/GOBP family
MATNRKPLFAIWLLVFLVECAHCDMTFEQMMKAGETMRRVCQPKFKVTDGNLLSCLDTTFGLFVPTVTDQLNEIREKRFPEDKALKCYTNCLMEMMQSVIMTFKLQERLKISFESCRTDKEREDPV